jgi:hypothetical protein
MYFFFIGGVLLVYWLLTLKLVAVSTSKIEKKM